MDAPTFRDPLARALWEARAESRFVSAPALDPALSPERARAIADELYGAAREGGASQVGWKLGATSPGVQALLGTDGPFAAPVFSSTVLPSGSRVSLGQLVVPRLELEIGLRCAGDSITPLACLEIVDSRIRDWELSIAEAIADFGLHAFAVFGEPRTLDGLVEAVLSHDGVEVLRAAKPVDEARRATRFLDEGWQDAADGAVLVATGSLGPPIPLSPGLWKADFGELGVLTLELEAGPP